MAKFSTEQDKLRQKALDAEAVALGGDQLAIPGGAKLFITPDFTHSKAHKQSWMIVFGDLLALMVTFFILLYGTSSIPQEDWELVASSLKDSLNVPSKTEGKPEPREQKKLELFEPVGISLDYLKAVLSNKINQETLFDELTLSRYEDKLVISLSTERYFIGNTGTLSREGFQVLGGIAALLRNVNNQITVIGHTNPDDVDENLWQSKWHMTLQRAISVAEGLYLGGYQTPVTAFGRGDINYSKLDASLDQATKYYQSRKVDIEIRERLRNNDPQALFKF
jgi:chemotaxis protein MotB